MDGVCVVSVSVCPSMWFICGMLVGDAWCVWCIVRCVWCVYCVCLTCFSVVEVL